MDRERWIRIGRWLIAGAPSVAVALFLLLWRIDSPEDEEYPNPPVIEYVTPIGFTANGSQFLCRIPGDSIAVWNWPTGTRVETVPCNGNFPVRITQTPGFVGIADCGNVRCWNATTRVWDTALQPPAGQSAHSIAASPDGARLAVLFGKKAEEGFYEGELSKIWDEARSPCELVIYNTTDWTRERSLLRFVGAGNLCRFSPDGRLLALSGLQLEQGSMVERIAIVNVEDARTIRQFRPDPIPGFRWSIVSFSPDAERIVCGTDYLREDETGMHESWRLRVWNMQSGRLEWQERGNKRGLWDVEFSPDGQLLACADMFSIFESTMESETPEQSIDQMERARYTVWNTADWKLVRQDQRGGNCCGDIGICHLVEGPDALYAAFCSPNAFHLYDVRTGEEVRTIVVTEERVHGN